MTLTLLHLLLLWGHALRQVGAAFQLPPFLQTLSERTLSQSRADGSDRLFTLPAAVANVPNIRRFTPRRKHLKPHKLMRRMRKDWDPFWMSAERPQEVHGEVVREAPTDPTLVKALERLNFTLRRGPNGAPLILEESVQHVLGAWLMQRSTCHVHYVWDDLGILYWPRWVRRGFCEAGDSHSSRPSSSSFSHSSLGFSPSSSATPSLSSSCSWPPGMHCVPCRVPPHPDPALAVSPQQGLQQLEPSLPLAPRTPETQTQGPCSRQGQRQARRPVAARRGPRAAESDGEGGGPGGRDQRDGELEQEAFQGETAQAEHAVQVEEDTLPRHGRLLLLLLTRLYLHL